MEKFIVMTVRKNGLAAGTKVAVIGETPATPMNPTGAIYAEKSSVSRYR